MNVELQPAWEVARRELRDQFRDWRIIVPIIGFTLFFPALMNFTADRVVRFVQRYGASLIGERLIPFLLMVVGFFPISISLVIALESFVGEKERRSIEPLLASPLEDWQLYVGKLVASTVPPLTASYLGIVVYLVAVHRQVGWTAPPGLLTQIVVLTTVQALLMVSGAVVISTQATSTRSANLLASLIIIPVAFLIQWESLVMFWGRYDTLWWVIFAELVVTGLLVRMGVVHFNREELLGRELDILDLRGSVRRFWRAFRGEATSLPAWYRQQVGPAVRALGWPVLAMSGLQVAAVLIGMRLAAQFELPVEALSLERLHQGVLGLRGQFALLHTQGVLLVWLINLRAVLLASLAGGLSFGVAGVGLLMLPLAITGYLMATLARAGIPPLTFLAALILPHGVVEIPAAILAGAAILRLGARLVTPGHDATIGDIWLQALADWAKVVLGVVFPLLLLAAALEVLVTPRVALALLP